MYPAVTKVTAPENYRIRVEFDNNESGLLNMQPDLAVGVFKQLKAANVFNSIKVSFDTIKGVGGID